MSARGGRIVTFYSYKGGTGRSMALSNLAWVLAANRRRVLIVDWDLEAPGLHRYFHPFLSDKELSASRGLIDLLADYADQAIELPAEGEGSDWYRALTDVSPYLVGINFAGFPEGGRIDLLPAGRKGAAYASKLQAFDWDTFYERLGGGSFLEALKEVWRENYDFVLIDSRTGVSDTAGICTVQMPDVLVAIFTYNNQSLRGALAVARSAVDARRRLYGQFSRESFRVFPVPSRADPFEVRKLQLRQTYARKLFTPLLDHLPEAEHNAYWTAVEVPYNAFLNYEEVLSPLIFNPDDPKLPLCSVLRLAAHVSDGEVTRYSLPLSPEQKQALLLAYEQVDDEAGAPATTPHESPADALLRSADALLGQLGEDELKIAARLLLRLVRLPRGQEAAGLKRLLVPVGDLAPGERPLLDRFVQAGILRLAQAQNGTTTVEIADDILLGRWRELNAWAEAEHDFLEQRYWLQASWEQWQRAGRPDSLLLAPPLAEQGARLLASHAELLSRDEIDFVNSSRSFRAVQAAPAPARPQPGRSGVPVWIAVAGGLLIAAVGVGAMLLGQARQPAPPPHDLALPQSANVANSIAAAAVTSADAAATGFYIAGEQSLAAGRYDEAIENFTTAIKLRETPDALFKRAQAYRHKGERDKAIADLEAGLRLQADRADARLQLAALFEQNDRQAAIREYQASLALNLNAEQRRTANQALEKLNPSPGEPKVYLHINNRADFAFAERLVADLETVGAQSKGVQILAQSTNADVRYGNVADERIARQIRDRVQASLYSAGYKRQVQLIYIGNTFQNVERGHIEVWLPPLAPAAKAGPPRKAY